MSRAATARIRITWTTAPNRPGLPANPPLAQSAAGNGQRPRDDHRHTPPTLEVLVRGVALLLAGVAVLLTGCGRTAAVTDTAAASAAPAAAAAALPLTEAEHDFVAALAAERIGDDIDVR